MKMIPQKSQLQQGGGSIIINRLAVLKPAATDPSNYNFLPDPCKLEVDLICSKAPGAVTDDDIKRLASLIHVAVHC